MNTREINNLLTETANRSLTRFEEVELVKSMAEEVDEYGYTGEELAKMSSTELKRIKSRLIKEGVK